MRATRRVRFASAVLLAGTSIGIYAAVTSAAVSAGPGHGRLSRSEHFDHGRGSQAGAPRGPSVTRFDLNGYVLVTDYTLGRNTGNTFRQTYTDSMVQGVPIKGPFVGTTFPPEDYVAMPIGNHELYVAWLDPKNTHWSTCSS
jgi:hypothetical protein